MLLNVCNAKDRTPEEWKDELVKYLDDKAAELLSARGIARAMHEIRRVSDVFIDENPTICIAANVANIVGGQAKKLADYARKLDVDEIEKILDIAVDDDEVGLFKSDIVSAFIKDRYDEGEMVYIAACGLIGIDIYETIKYYVEEIDESKESQDD